MSLIYFKIYQFNTKQNTIVSPRDYYNCILMIVTNICGVEPVCYTLSCLYCLSNMFNITNQNVTKYKIKIFNYL